MLATQNDDENTAWLEVGGRKMNCQKCNGKTEIIDTEKFSMYVWRRRQCLKCRFRMNTHENFVEDVKAARTKKKPEPKVEPLPVRNTRKQIEDLREYLERRREDSDDRC